MIRHLTGATTRHLTDKNSLVLPDHLFFYKRGELPYSDSGKFYDSIKNHHIVIGLQISRGCPVPASWVTVLEETKMKDPDFDFVRLADADGGTSVCNVYFDGVLQDSHLISHDSHICLSDDVFRKGVERIIDGYVPALYPPDEEEFVGDLIEEETSDGHVPIVSSPSFAENNSAVIEIPGDLIFFYKRGNLAIADEKTVSASIENHYRVICLHIPQGCSVPESWILVLNKLKGKYPDFDFVRLADVKCPDSTINLVVDGVMQDETLQIPHDGTVCLNGESFEAKIKRICKIKTHRDASDRILDQWGSQFQL